MKEPVKILFIAQELHPYLPESTMANLCRQLSQFVQEHGCEVRIFMPCYGNINERRNQLHEVQRLSGMNLIIDDTDHPLIIKVATLPTARLQVYFIDNDDYFRRRGTTIDENGTEFADNDDRMIFFARGVLETIKKLRWTPNVIHCHGWMTALIPMYMRTAYRDDPFFSESKLIYSDYGDGFTNVYDRSFAQHSITKGVSEDDVRMLSLSRVGYEEVTNLAANYSDVLDAATENALPTLEKMANECNTPFSPFEADFKQKYLRLFGKICPALELD